MERARVNGIELEYEISGSGEPVLLIHGSHVAGSFKPLLAQPALTEEYMLIRYHRRGHLDSSPATGPVSIEQQAADARALLEYLHAQPAHVVGHSYGGAIAMQLALDAPESVHSLALLEAALLTVPRGRVVSELNALAARLYSLGRTGRPKGVVHLQHDMRFCADTYAKHVLEIDESDTTFSISKLCYAYGLGCGLYFPFSAGATTVLLDEPPQPRAVLALTKEFHPTIFCGIPTSYASLLATAVSAWKSSDFGSVRVCVSATEPLGGSLLKRWKERTGLDILDGIDSTESCHIFISNRMGDVRPDCSGTVVEGFEARVVNDGGQEVPPGERGMLVVKGDSICAFYWHEHELTKETIRGDWLKTGDTYIKDESGYFFYQGRADDMLKVGGMWVSPREIETVLEEHESVAECAVVGVRDNDGLVRPEAFVVLENSGGEQALEATLRQYMRQHLGGNKTPRAFHFVKSLPETARGKTRTAAPRSAPSRGDREPTC